MRVLTTIGKGLTWLLSLVPILLYVGMVAGALIAFNRYIIPINSGTGANGPTTPEAAYLLDQGSSLAASFLGVGLGCFNAIALFVATQRRLPWLGSQAWAVGAAGSIVLGFVGTYWSVFLAQNSTVALVQNSNHLFQGFISAFFSIHQTVNGGVVSVLHTQLHLFGYVVNHYVIKWRANTRQINNSGVVEI